MSNNVETLNNIKKELMKQKDLGLPIKDDMYEHLNELFNRIMLHHPHDAYTRFETISYLVKQNNFKIADPQTDNQINARKEVITNKQALDLIEKAKNLLNEHIPGQ